MGGAVLLGRFGTGHQSASERRRIAARCGGEVGLAALGGMNPWALGPEDVGSAAIGGEKCGLRNLIVSLPR